MWGFVELAVSTVGAYNIVKGVYNLYCDTEYIKNQYRTHQATADQYRKSQLHKSVYKLTESQFQHYEGEFMILNKSTINDPFN